MISSRHNKNLQTIRRLRRCKGDLAVLEGPHLLAEAVTSGVPLRQVLVTPDFAAGAEGRALLAGLEAEILEVSPELLERLADADSPRGALAVASLPRGGCGVLPVASGVYLYLDGVQDPGNLGAIARVAEAAGCVAVACGPTTAHPNHPRALRASAGSLLRLPVARGVAAPELSDRLAPVAPEWVALVAHDGEDLYRAELPAACVLVLGSEGGGIEAAVAAACRPVRIPLEPPVESLNVATAAAVALFELRRRRQAG